MKKIRTKKAVIIIAAAVLCIAAYLFYSRPMTIQQRYPMLTLDQCVGIDGHYRGESGTEFKKFAIDKNSEEFEMLCDLLYKREYRRLLKDLLPKGTRYRASEPGDFEWEVYFNFEGIEFPDGNIGSGQMLHIQSWYGELSIRFDGVTLYCRTADQENWAKEIFEIIQ